MTTLTLTAEEIELWRQVAASRSVDDADNVVYAYRERLKTKDLRMQQILEAPFNIDGKLTYSIYGLGTDGVVYRYDPKCEAWIAWPMTVASCRADHKARR